MLTIKHTPELTRLSEISHIPVERLKERIIDDLAELDYIVKDIPDYAGLTLKKLIEQSKSLNPEWNVALSIFRTVDREINNLFPQLVLFWDDENGCEGCGIKPYETVSADGYTSYIEKTCQNPNCKEHGKTHRSDIQKLEREY
jgi:hypothetical protein